MQTMAIGNSSSSILHLCSPRPPSPSSSVHLKACHLPCPNQCSHPSHKLSSSKSSSLLHRSSHHLANSNSSRLRYQSTWSNHMPTLVCSHQPLHLHNNQFRSSHNRLHLPNNKAIICLETINSTNNPPSNNKITRLCIRPRSARQVYLSTKRSAKPLRSRATTYPNGSSKSSSKSSAKRWKKSD